MLRDEIEKKKQLIKKGFKTKQIKIKRMRTKINKKIN